jgi:RNA polymerase sigma-70 factor (ECF subfamily)
MLRLLISKARAASDGPEAGPAADPLRELVSQAVRGDTRAERTLLVTLGPSLLRSVRGVLGAHHPDVEDVLQETMVRVHDALPRFRGECQAVHFASRIAVNTALNARRYARHRVKHTPPVAPDDMADCADESPSPTDALASARLRASLRELLLELPAVQAEVLALHIVLGYSVQETASAMGVPHNTVRSRLRAALADLRDRVQSSNVLVEVVGGQP